ncbi:MAG TPA: pitrilysin family protein [Anaerolineae bacterium]|nr:pitrilysin family protein [Anaerolineae bacterium]
MLADGVLKTYLDNGLAVILKETHRAPVASFWVWYRVGSRNEQVGITGISHWVEHMMFRGTEQFPAGVADRLISRRGGDHNAMTYLDWTSYYETLPAEDIDLAMAVEADRMVNAIFLEEGAELERTVIISERQGSENYPAWLLHEELVSMAFKVHSYGHMTIGWQSDLDAMTRDDLERHYQEYYSPSNAVVVAVGDFNAEQVLRQIKSYFGNLPAGPPREAVRGLEPVQRGERRCVVEGPGETAYLTIGFHAPPALDEDFFPMAVIDTLLGGARSMSLFHDGEPSRSSRLYKALVDSGLASEASSYLLPTIDPYLFICSATLQDGQSLDDLEAALLAELDRLTREPVTPDELRKAVHQTRAQFTYSAESVTDQAFWLGFAEIVADLDWLNRFPDSLAAVTAEDVQRVAASYLDACKRTVARYVPTEDE